MFLPGGFTPSFRLPMASCWIWLARHGEHSRPSNLVSPAACESLGAFADRAIDAIERVGSLSLKHHRCPHRALVHEIEDSLDRRRAPVERQFDDRGVDEASPRQRVPTFGGVAETEDRRR